jgi:hypothetical protein
MTSLQGDSEEVLAGRGSLRLTHQRKWAAQPIGSDPNARCRGSCFMVLEKGGTLLEI